MFGLYSTTLTKTLYPEELTPGQGETVILLPDPSFGNWEEYEEGIGRGTVFQTLSGVFIQEFPTISADRILRFSDSDALTRDQVEALRAAYDTLSKEWYLTDGVQYVWKVRFYRPGGFVARRNLLWAVKGSAYYSYEMKFVVLEETYMEQ